MNAIDDDLPRELAAAVAQADADRDVHVMVLSGAGKAFCSGYDLAHLRRRQRPQPGGAGDALGSDAGFPVHVGEYAGLYVALSRDETGDLQSAWFCCGRRLGHRALRGPDDHGGHSTDRLHALPRLGAARRQRCGCIGWVQKRPSA